MKAFLFLIVTIAGMQVFIGCADKKNKNVSLPAKDTVKSVSETVMGRNLDIYPLLPASIKLDTTSIEPNIHHSYVDIVMPVISRKEHPWLHDKLKNFKDTILRNFLKETAHDTVPDEGAERGEFLFISSESLYKTDSIVSFILETGQGVSTAGFWYAAFNFDKRTGKPIRFDDYFKLKSVADTNSLARKLSIASERPVEECIKYVIQDSEVVFGFDEENVHLCFERYHMFHWGTLSIQKKFLLDNIQARYR
jgi:hypothetical protein